MTSTWGIPDFELNRLPLALETLPEFLRSQGYKTFGVAANPNISAEQGFDQGFDRFRTLGLEDAEAIRDVVQEWSADIRESQPYHGA